MIEAPTPFEGFRATRRAVLAGAAGAGALAVAPVEAAAAALDLASAPGRLRAYMQMRGALDGRLVAGFVSGVYYGVVEEEITPLYGVVAATFARYRRRADGGFDGASYEAPFFTDLDSGEALERWRNPYTGRTVAAQQQGFPPARLVIGPDLQIVSPAPLPSMAMTSGVVSTLQSGPDVWMTERTTSAVTPPGAAKPARYSEVVTLHALRADFRPAVPHVACQTSYTSVVSWRPWLGMGDRPGHLMGTGAGAYGVELDAFPDTLARALARHRPDILTHPDAPLAGLFRNEAS